MYHIKNVEIDGFWGKYKIKTDFHPDVNIFIGKNGSGKTTFINLLQGVLQVDLPTLISNDFTKITLRLELTRSKTRVIKVEREDDPNAPFELVTFKVGTKSFKLQVYERRDEFRRLRNRPHFAEQYEALKSEIDKLVQVSSLSVHRMGSKERYEEDLPRRYPVRSKAPIDQRLNELMQGLTSFQVLLATAARQLSARFEKNVLASMLYDPQFDTWDPKPISAADLGKQKQDLLKAFEELGALDDAIRQRINTHIEKLSATSKKFRVKPQSVTVDEIMPLPLLRRTYHILDLAKATEEEKQALYHPIYQFVETILGFVEDKNFDFSPSGELVITKDNTSIPISQLSSGEKQLLILLTETILQKNAPFVFLADEPELSLHIEWQEKIISSIKKLNELSQVIMATHSPEIAAGWKQNLINMEDIVSE